MNYVIHKTQDSAAQQCQLDPLNALSHSNEWHDRPSLAQVWRSRHKSKYNNIKRLPSCDYRNYADKQASPQSVTRVSRYRYRQYTPQSILNRYPANNSNIDVRKYVITPQFSSHNHYQDDSLINYLSTKINLPTLSTYEQRRQRNVLHLPDGHVNAPARLRLAFRVYHSYLKHDIRPAHFVYS
ncbi:hypothetical protein GJ496_007558 [Pomphorhynchus laevis]|nr:hypothetical protein GJ496_007558 [Pomphorhynchus laevis]